MITDQPAPQTELDQARDLLDVALGQRDEARTALASLRAAAEADTVEHERVRAERDELATRLDTAIDAALDADERWILARRERDQLLYELGEANRAHALSRNDLGDARRERDQLRDELALLVGPPRETPTSRIGQPRTSTESGCGQRRSDEPDRVCALSPGHFGAWHADHHGAWTDDDTNPAAAPANGAQ